MRLLRSGAEQVNQTDCVSAFRASAIGEGSEKLPTLINGATPIGTNPGDTYDLDDLNEE